MYASPITLFYVSEVTWSQTLTVFCFQLTSCVKLSTVQAGAFQPFFRAHAHLDTRRREPWLLPPTYFSAVRSAIIARYRLLPYWYWLFFDSERTGAPVMRPMWVEFPTDRSIFTTEDQHFVGSALLLCPVTQSSVTVVKAYLPSDNQVTV